MFLVTINSASALDPDKFITQYGHTAWRVQDGLVYAPNAFAQTKDGYIWIGTGQGLMRFNGAKFNIWNAPEGQPLPGNQILALLGASDGSLWIGTEGGIARLKNNQLSSYASQVGNSGISAIIEDETEAIWFTRYRVTDEKGPLCRLKDEELRCYGKDDGIKVRYGLGLKKDSAGNIWFGSEMLYRWSPNATDTYFEEELKHAGGNGVVDVAIESSGAIWAAIDGIGPKLGVRRYSDGKWSSYMAAGFNGAEVRASALFVDSKNSLWVGTGSQGLYHIYKGIADHYGIANGLSGDSVSSVYEDKEGNIWVATDGGVDMFRDTPVVSFTTNEKLSGTTTGSVIALRDGTVLVGNQQAVDVLRVGGKSAITRLHGLPGEDVKAMLEDRSGRIWIGVADELKIYENNRFSDVKKSEGSSLGHVGLTMSLTEDADANIWALILKPDGRYLLRIKDRIVEEEIPLDNSIRRAIYLAADNQANIWIATMNQNLARYHNGQMEIISLWSGEGLFATYSLFVDSENAVWVSTSKGLYRWKNGVLNLLNDRNGLPCSSVNAVIEDNSGSLWLYAQCGLLKIPAADLKTWRELPESKVSVKVFDSLDGAFPIPTAIICPRAAKSPGGRLWFVNGIIAQTIDPNRSYDNAIPPPVHIEELFADHKIYQTEGQINLPPLQNELEINYAALSYTVPQKVKFRYKLEGADDDWQDVGSRRQAFYNNLGPGQYRFRVIAANNDGIWNETGATLDFTIEPAWYQTTAFRILCLLLAGLIVWALYRFRIKQISKVISMRFDERLAERTRLAREMHDTFLQTIQGSKLVADDALEKPNDPVQMKRAMMQLSAWLGQATDEGRAALNSLRATTTEKNDLAEAFRRATENYRLKESAQVEFSVVGDSKEMHPIVRDEIYRIGYEAIYNACRHSEASRLEVELRYGQDLTLSVKDNGIGIKPIIVAEGKDGHFGLQGMRERAERIGAKLTIVSSETSGTEIILVVPGSIIFTNMR